MTDKDEKSKSDTPREERLENHDESPMEAQGEVNKEVTEGSSRGNGEIDDGGDVVEESRGETAGSEAGKDKDPGSFKKEPKAPKKKKTFFLKALDGIERVGNRLPHPATIFAILAGAVIVFSWIASLVDWTAQHPNTGKSIQVFNLISGDGLRYMFVSVTDNFVGFPPFGIVLVAMVGIGVAEGSGLIEAMLKHTVLRAPKRIVTAVVVATGILSHLGSSVGYVVLIPLGAMVFLAFGRHPVAGIAAAFVGVSGGFGANFFIGSVDPILAGLSESAAQIIDPNISVNPAVNFYFMLTSAVMVTIVGTVVTEKIVEPRLGEFKHHIEDIKPLEDREIRGVRWAFVSLLAISVLFLILVVPEGGLLHGDESVLKGPFFQGIITAMLIVFLMPGLVYGFYVGTIRNDRDLMNKIVTAMKGLAPYIVLVFFAAQFVFFFKKSNLGIILAIKGAQVIKSVGVSGVGLIIIFVLFSATMNLFMGSASAKWAIMAPVFVPMFMLSGYHPALTQAAFRIGDSVTNIITPMMSYFALILTFMEKYDKKAGIGTLIATMLPYSIILTIIWTLLLTVWYVFGLPLGPGGPLHF